MNQKFRMLLSSPEIWKYFAKAKESLAGKTSLQEVRKLYTPEGIDKFFHNKGNQDVGFTKADVATRHKKAFALLSTCVEICAENGEEYLDKALAWVQLVGPNPYLQAIAIAIAFILVGKIADFVISRVIAKLAARSSTDLDDDLVVDGLRSQRTA